MTFCISRNNITTLTGLVALAVTYTLLTGRFDDVLV